mmetsp:Transcript_3357/g.6309  ORF Transcript_3357/g.6309 Transcript_3357/m.6309 type:complete len:110 (+) Transcript_3357:1150-1479(+)
MELEAVCSMQEICGACTGLQPYILSMWLQFLLRMWKEVEDMPMPSLARAPRPPLWFETLIYEESVIFSLIVMVSLALHRITNWLDNGGTLGSSSRRRSYAGARTFESDD